uniref:Small ribosomal subunit protein uS3m n=1 Tax=Pseudolarix amabilis TaxID=3355 RepID=D2DWI0_PSEAD|nr:ribosomal protein S3 [Pseudolarix amabilis]
MARKVNPISVRLNLNRSSDSSWFSDYYYGKLVYQDVNLRDYFGSIRPPTRKTFGFRLGRCIIHHFPKRTFIHLFLPRRPRRLKRRGRSRAGKGRWWAFGKVRSIGFVFDGTEEERNEVRGISRGAGETVKSIGLAGEERSEVRIWPRTKQRYGYHDRSPSRRSNIEKLLRVSGWMAYKHPMSGKYAANQRFVNDIAFLIGNDDSFGKPKFFKFFFPNQFRGTKDSTSNRLIQTIPAVRPSFNYLVMQYFFHMENQIPFDPIDVVVLNHFVAPEPGRADRQGGSLDKRIRSRIGFFVESLTAKTEQGELLAEANKRVTHFIFICCRARFARTTKTCWSILLFPFFGATFFFLRDNLRVSNNKNCDALPLREQLLGRLRRKLRNLLGKEKVIRLVEKFISLGRGGFMRGIGMMIEIILRNRRIPYGYNYYLNEVRKMRSLLSNRTNTNTFIGSVKIFNYQSASLIAQDISFQLRDRTRSFRSIFSQIVRDIPLVMPKGVRGIRICCSGRLKGAEIARTECREYGKTSCNVFRHKIDYASAKVSTRYGILGVKVWISLI